jgi:membrane-bound serine protease (ClpP class)
MRLRMILWLLFVITGLVGMVIPAQAAYDIQATPLQTQSPTIIVLRFDGAIHPAMMEYLKRAMQAAERQGAEAIILELNTPGGSIDLMNQLVSSIRGSDIPVIVYVAPRGAMAGSAGTLITLAGHVAAMAPETSIGAASPVGAEGQDIGEAMESKVKEMLRANVRGLAANRPPEAIELAEEMIETARAVSVDEALEIGLIDIKASSITDLINQADGQEVIVQDEARTLNLTGATLLQVDPTFLEEMLMVLSNPNIAFILLAIGVQAILIEISSPGGWIAGFIGAVSLLLATYGLGMLPVNWFGFLFLAVAFVLFILELQTPTAGALTAAGVASFIIGALVLFNSPNVPQFQRVSIPLVVATGASLGLVFFVIVGYALRAQRRPASMGRETLVGQVGTVSTPLEPVGTVQIGSELWTAVLENGEPPLKRGEQIQVVGTDGLRVRVKKLVVTPGITVTPDVPEQRGTTAQERREQPGTSQQPGAAPQSSPPGPRT